jgi:sporulation protein YlmC with PRC-barrel domain
MLLRMVMVFSLLNCLHATWSCGTRCSFTGTFSVRQRTQCKFASSGNSMARRALLPDTPSHGGNMTTASGHTSAILASRVKGTAVYNQTGDKIGTVEDIVLDKESNQILFAALGLGGLLGIGEKYYPVPWSLLDYDKEKGGYVVPLDKAQVDKAPNYDLKDLTKHDGSLGSVREASYSYYRVTPDWH